MSTFEDYCRGKKIDPDLFKSNESLLYNEWQTMFGQTSPASFTQQKLFLINNIRRKYKLIPTVSIIAPQEVLAAKITPKPVFKPKMN